MFKRLLIFAVYFISIYSMEPGAKFVIGVHNESSKDFRIKILDFKKTILLDKNLRPTYGLEQVLYPQESPIVFEVYDGHRLEYTETVDFKNMRLPYFDSAKKESGFGYIIKISSGKIQLSKDFNYFGTPQSVQKSAARPLPPTPGSKPAGRPLPAAPGKPAPRPLPIPGISGRGAAQPATASAQYEIVVKNLWYTPVRIEVIGARSGKAAQGNMLVNQSLGRNEEYQQEFDANVYPITLRVYMYDFGQEKLVLEDEVNLPALKINHFEFYVVNDRKNDGKATLQFVPDVTHGPAIKQKNIEPHAQRKYSQPTTAQPSAAQSTKPMLVRYDTYEVNLAHGSRLPLRYRLVTSSGRVLFEGTIPGSSPTERKYPSTPLYQVLPSDFPLKVYSFDDSGMSGNFEFNFSLDQALSESAKTRTALANARSVTFGNENQFTITVDDSRPTRTGPGHTHSRISALTQ